MLELVKIFNLYKKRPHIIELATKEKKRTSQCFYVKSDLHSSRSNHMKKYHKDCHEQWKTYA